MLTISEEDFLRMVTFIKSKYGINLQNKKHIIESRLATNLKQQGYESFTPYVNLILKNNTDDIINLLNRITTNHTYFYRESAHFDYFKNKVLPYLEQTKKVKSLNIWSAGCSSGEEPYTLSMILDEYFSNKPQKWDTRILATDISNNVLEKANKAIYKEESVGFLPDKFKDKYFEKAGEDYRVVKKIRDNVIFRPFNLMGDIKFKVNFDVIFCRNVMIYFDKDDKAKLIDRFYGAQEDGGFLFIGLSESIDKSRTKYKYLSPGTYRKI